MEMRDEWEHNWPDRNALDSKSDKRGSHFVDSHPGKLPFIQQRIPLRLPIHPSTRTAEAAAYLAKINPSLDTCLIFVSRI